jgi:hypothetical protein
MNLTLIAITALVIALLAIAFAVWALLEVRKTRRLRSKFGPEYDRAVQNEPDARHAEAVLEKREERVSKYNLRPLTPRERERFAEEWRVAQERFVDNPRKAVAEADQLIEDAMKARGYPISDFKAQAADLSVDYPVVVEHYRAAHEIDLRQNGERADTEELRRAMQHYHVLFEEVIGTYVMQHNQEVR